MSDVECPTCGRDGFDSEQGMKSHHVQVHGESIAGVEFTCTYCGERERKPKCRVDRHEKNFCNSECYGKWRSAHVRGENHHQYNRVEVECDNCGQTELRQPRHVHEHVFCNSDCFGEWMSENWTGEDGPNWSGGPVTVTCDNCGDGIERPESEVIGQERFFCNYECQGMWLSENLLGDDHPAWKGGLFPYGEGWSDKKKEAVRERDGRRCQNCGRSEENHIELFGKKHHVHHIIGARKIDDPEERNAMGNLITLCAGECHAKWEGIPLRPIAD